MSWLLLRIFKWVSCVYLPWRLMLLVQNFQQLLSNLLNNVFFNSNGKKKGWKVRLYFNCLAYLKINKILRWLTWKIKMQQTQRERGIFNGNSVSQRSETKDHKDLWNRFLIDRHIKKCMGNMYSLACTNTFDTVIPKCSVTGIAYFPWWEISMNQKRKNTVYSEWCVYSE